MTTKLISHIARLLFFISVASWSSHSIADGFVKGKVEFIRTHDAIAQPTWIPPLFWFTLKGVTNAGSCAQWTAGKILFAAKDAQALNLVVIAMQSNKEIAVSFSDSNLINGFCTANYVTIGNPVAPLY